MGVLDFIRYLFMFVVSYVVLYFVYSKLMEWKYRHKKPAPEVPPTFTPIQVAKSAPVIDWKEIHRYLRISLTESQTVDEVLPLPNGESKVVRQRKEVFIDPEVNLTEAGIELTYPADKHQSLSQLVSLCPVYSQMLADQGAIPSKGMVVEQGKLPWIFFFRFIDENVKSELEIKSIMDRCSWGVDSPTGQRVYPRISFEEDDMLVDITEARLTKDRVGSETAMALFSSIFNKNYKFVEKVDNNTFRMLNLKPRTDILFKFGDTVVKKFEEWKEKVLTPLIEFSKSARKPSFFLGEIQDPMIYLATKIYADINTVVHMVIIGKTGSGKSTTLVSLIYHLAKMAKSLYAQEDIWYFADGKMGGDTAPAAKYLSKYGVATNIVELVNIIKLAFAEYQRRQVLFSKVRADGIPCTSIYEYRESVGHLPWVYIVIDEFKSFTQDMDFDALKTSPGSLPYMLSKLTAEARSSGFTFIFASQRYQQDTFPTAIRGMLGTKLIHALELSDANFMNVSIDGFTKGEYYLQLDGLFCPKTNINNIRCRMPFLGASKDFTNLLEKDFEVKEHIPFDHDLIYNDGNSDDMGKADTVAQWKFIKKLFIQEQGFKVLKMNDVLDHQIQSVDICAILEAPDKKKIAFGMLESSSELNEHLYFNNARFIQRENPAVILTFCDWDLKPADLKNIEAWKEENKLPVNWVFYSKSMYIKKLKKAFTDYENGNRNTSFIEIMADVMDNFQIDEPPAEGGEDIKKVFREMERTIIEEARDGIQLMEHRMISLEDLIENIKNKTETLNQEIEKKIKEGK